MAYALRPAGGVHAGRDDVGALPPPGHDLGQGQLVGVEGHVHVVLPQPQLLRSSLEIPQKVLLPIAPWIQKSQ